MAVEVARASYFQWPQSPLPSRSTFSLRTLAFSFSDRSIACVHHTCQQSPFLGTALVQHSHHRGRVRGGRRGTSPRASLDGFVDDDENDLEIEKSKKELAIEFKLEAESRLSQNTGISKSNHKDFTFASPVPGKIYTPFPSLTPEILSVPPDPWPTCDALSPEKVERRANSFELPLSLRILKRKKKCRETTVIEDFACCSVRKTFSSMVFIVQVVQRDAIRKALFSSSNLQSQVILARVHDDLQASFVWLFQHIFSTTPTFMIYLMLLLANFTVFSITDFSAAATQPSQSVSTIVEDSENPTLLFDTASFKTFSIDNSFVGDKYVGCDGGKLLPIAGAFDDGKWDRSFSSLHNAKTISPEVLSTAAADEEYARAWSEILQEADRIRANERHEALIDPDTLRRFVSPVRVAIEPDDLSAYSMTELSYRRALAEDPDNPLILSNFAQFLYLVLRDHNSAEEYFKRAARAEPADAEVLSRYANFKWVAKEDFAAAEEIFLEAIAADPGNSYYSANYAHFLWSTGGVDTCYPLDVCDP